MNVILTGHFLGSTTVALYLAPGGAGFIGSPIVCELTERAKKVRILDNPSVGTIVQPTTIRDRIVPGEHDRGNLGDVRPPFERAKYVIAWAALPSVAPSMTGPITPNPVNIDGILNVLVAARE